MATPKKDKSREERAKEIPASDFQALGNGVFLVKGKYETDGRNCHCGDNRFARNDCVHAIRARDLFSLKVAPLVPEASNVAQIADYR